MNRILVLLLCVLTACGTVPANTKIYSIQPAQGGLVRKQANEVLPYAKARGYLCVSPSDFEAVASCNASAVKVWYLEPARNGLYRKQAGQVLPWANARGYLCTSPTDFRTILEQCAAQGGAK